MHSFTPRYTHTHTHIHIYTYTYTHIHIYTYTHIQPAGQFLVDGAQHREPAHQHLHACIHGEGQRVLLGAQGLPARYVKVLHARGPACPVAPPRRTWAHNAPLHPQQHRRQPPTTCATRSRRASATATPSSARASTRYVHIYNARMHACPAM